MTSVKNFKIYKPYYSTSSSVSSSSSNSIYYNLSSDVTQFTLPSTTSDGYTVRVRSIYNDVEVIAPVGTTIVGYSDGIIKTFIYNADTKTYIIDDTENYSFYPTRELVKLSSDNIVVIGVTGVAQGYSVALSTDGLTLAVGSKNDGEQGTDMGATYIYRYNIVSGEWTEQAKLFSSNATNATVQQGYSVALSADGNTLAVGSPYDDEQNTNFGATYIYRYNSGEWTEQAKLFSSNATNASVQQGRSVALSADGNTLAVGSPFDDEQGNSMGATYIYRYNSGSWTEQAKLFSSNATTTSVSQGYSVALSADGNTLAVGSLYDDEQATDFGATYIYRYNSGSWTEEAKLFSSNAAGTSVYQGSYVALSADGNILAVGSPNDDEQDTSMGAAYIYRYNSGSWTEQAKLMSINALGTFVQQGNSVALSADGHTLAVGAKGNDIIGNDNYGATFIYKYNTQTEGWEEKNALFNNEPSSSGAQQGWSVDLSGDGSVLAVGAVAASSSNGVTYIYN